MIHISFENGARETLIEIESRHVTGSMPIAPKSGPQSTRGRERESRIRHHGSTEMLYVRSMSSRKESASAPALGMPLTTSSLYELGMFPACMCLGIYA